MKNHCTYLFRSFSLAVLLLGTGIARADNALSEMHVVAMPLVDVLAWFSQETGLVVDAPEGLSGRVTDVRLTTDSYSFTTWLTRDFGLDHYVMGATLYLSPGSESLRQMMPLDGVLLADLKAGVATLDARAAQPLRGAGQDGNAVLVAGPPAYVALVAAVLDDLKADRAMRGRIVVNRGGTITVDDLNARRVIYATPPAAEN
jgi:hypothetical protein